MVVASALFHLVVSEVYKFARQKARSIARRLRQFMEGEDGVAESKRIAANEKVHDSAA